MSVLVIYLILMNLWGFLLMGIDKRRAKQRAWRIPEKMLLGSGLLGGCLGAWAGMYFFRHKTRHWYFVVGMPGMIAFWALCIKCTLCP
ncbi:MAG: DUF1294 domain-containing protein [Roseburia sp.]